MEDHTTTDATLEILRDLRQDFPSVGAVLQAYLRRTEADCRDLAYEGSRVRLCKGTYKEPGSVAFQSKSEVDRSFVRCLKVLMAGQGYPMIASHDPRLVEIAGALAHKQDRAADTFEYQTPSSTRCSTASAPRSRSGSPTVVTRCGSTSPTVRSGTAT
jgi:proline dehydrogenase